jgi:glycosyltransferase involved in cell wall biosynthesis
MNKNKKICHITSGHFVWENRIFKKECSSLVANDYDVTLIGIDKISYKDVKNGVKRIALSIPVKNKLQRMLKRSKAVYKESLKINADIYHFHDIELFPYGLMLKKKGAKVIFDCHEDYFEYFKDVKWYPKIIGIIISIIIKIIFKKYLKKFDAVITVTPHIIDKFAQYTDHLYMITNYPIIDGNNVPSFSQRDYLNRDNELIYAGILHPRSNQEITLEAISKTPNIKYNIAGLIFDDYKKVLFKIPYWNKVNYLGYIALEDLEKVYKKSTIAIILLDYMGNVGYKNGSMGVVKVFEYMKFGLPIICTDFEVWEKMIIDKYNCGICVNPKNTDEVQKAIQYLCENKEIAYQMGQNAQKAVIEEFNWNTQSKVLLEIYQNL